MKILFLAPHPFFQERGTPIQDDLLLKTLSDRGDTIDVLTYHEGTDRQYPRVAIHRIKPWGNIANIRPGFSWKKIYCDIFIFARMHTMVTKNSYDLVYAVEESVFMVLFMRLWKKIPYVYDMDSQLSLQLVDACPWLRPFSGCFQWFEKAAVSRAIAVIGCCQALVDVAKKMTAHHAYVITDIAVQTMPQYVLHDKSTVTSLRDHYGLTGPIIMYVGNLESYQGIDLLLESFALIRATTQATLVIIGGRQDDIQKYRDLCSRLAIAKDVVFTGPKPPETLQGYLEQADILAAPRIQGENTPMKLYAYLYSKIPVVATNIVSHTQVLNDDIAVLADPDPKAFSQALVTLIPDAHKRARISAAAYQVIATKYSYDTYVTSVRRIFDEIGNFVYNVVPVEPTSYCRIPKGTRVLVTGATGFTGAFLVKKLVMAGVAVRAIARPSSNIAQFNGMPIEWVHGDVYDPAVVQRAVAGVSYIFHVAAAYREAKAEAQVYRAVHVTSTQLLAEAATRQPAFKRFIHVSTVGVLGHIEYPPADETTPYKPEDIYQETKAEAEQWLCSFARTHRLPFTVVRPTAILGPGDRRLLKLFKMARRGIVPLLGGHNTLYHMIHVEDLTDFMIHCATHPAAQGEITICGNTESTTVKDITRMAGEACGRAVKYIALPKAPLFLAGDVCEAICRPFGIEPPLYRRRIAFFTKDRAFNTQKMRNVMQFTPRFTNESGIAQTARWYREQKWL